MALASEGFLTTKIKSVFRGGGQSSPLPRISLSFTKNQKKIMKNNEKTLDIHGSVYYYIGARVWENSAHCDDAGDCATGR